MIEHDEQREQHADDRVVPVTVLEHAVDDEQHRGDGERDVEGLGCCEVVVRADACPDAAGRVVDAQEEHWGEDEGRGEDPFEPDEVPDRVDDGRRHRSVWSHHDSLRLRVTRDATFKSRGGASVIRPTLPQPVPEHGEEVVRTLEVDGVAGAGDDRELGLRDQPRHPRGDGAELVVESAGDDQHGHRQRGEVGPQRALRARAGEAQARSQPGGGVRPPTLETGGCRRQRGEHRERQPSVEERRHAVAFDLLGALFVGGAPRGTLLIVLDAGGGADEYEPLDPLGGRDRKLQRDAAAHRVADVGRRAPGVPKAAAVSTTSSCNSSDSPCPGASTATTS